MNERRNTDPTDMDKLMESTMAAGKEEIKEEIGDTWDEIDAQKNAEKANLSQVDGEEDTNFPEFTLDVHSYVSSELTPRQVDAVIAAIVEIGEDSVAELVKLIRDYKG